MLIYVLMQALVIEWGHKGPLLLTWFNFNPTTDK